MYNTIFIFSVNLLKPYLSKIKFAAKLKANEAFNLMFLINKGVTINKNRKTTLKKSFSGEVVLTRIELVSKV